DTLDYDGLAGKILPFTPVLALLPINGNDPAREVAGNLNIDESIELAKAIGAKWLIPCHYDMFTFNTADVNKFAGKASEKAQAFCILDIGGKICSRELEPVLFPA
ncbi:MAG: MBL fold metallo-hydrolase, partial [Chitinophagaceae bacterium]